MHIVLIIVLLALFAYALMLVILNNAEIAVDLVFSQAPQMNLGLLLIISLGLGVLIGLLMMLVIGRVLQTRWELAKAKKDIIQLQSKLDENTIALEQARKNHTVADMSAVALAEQQVVSNQSPQGFL